MSTIRLRQIRKVFNQGAPSEFWAVRGVDLNIDLDETTAIVGPSGSGKTTLLSMIGCLARPTSGRITLNGELLSGLPERFTTEIRRRRFGFIFQRFNLIAGLTVLENIMLPAYPMGPDHRTLKRRADSLLEQFRLGDKHASKIEWLSGGEAQRTAICRALINEPDILIADEPTANLDTRLSAEFMAIITSLKQEGKGIILSSHDPLVFNSEVVDRIVSIRDGRIAEN